MRLTTIYFEPWGLGDVLVAAAILRENPADAALACKSRWHPLLRAVLPGNVPLLPVDLPYTTQSRKNRFQLPEPGTGSSLGSASVAENCTVLDIRGDFRDWRAARRLFPRAQIRMSGWVEFPPHYSRLADVPFALGLLKTRNHYRAWAQLAGVPFPSVEETYRQRQSDAPRSGRVVIHLGSSRRSRQYPHAQRLAQLCEQQNFGIDFTAGPNDPLPQGISEEQVHRLADQAAVEVLRPAQYVITNDSAAMHLAALLGCRTLVVARVTNVQEWIPPATRFVASSKMPRGYKPDPRYNSDEIIEDWPAPEEVVGKLLAPVN